MNVLPIHQNFPTQFVHTAAAQVGRNKRSALRRMWLEDGACASPFGAMRYAYCRPTTYMAWSAPLPTTNPNLCQDLAGVML